MDRLDFSHERDLTIDKLVSRVEAYFPDVDLAVLKKAYGFAEKAHQGQKRSSGEDYIIHPLNVASTLIKLQMDLDCIIAGLLHDVVEDCEITPETIEKEFSGDIAMIVVGLTKISKIEFKTREESQAENFRKMVVAMAADIRVIIVKLADRMHNMRTLQYMSDEKQKQIAQETLDIYVPLASRLGINSVKAELEDLYLRFLKPEVYYRLAEKVAMNRKARNSYIEEVIDILKFKLMEFSVKAEVKGRPKHFYSIYKKMMSRGVDFEQIQDVLAFRVIVDNITECYKVLGVMHSSFTPIPGRFKDYIAIPKVNNYQSLHTAVIGPKAERIEVQIRTMEMDLVAETGVAAHWKYKEGGKSINKLDWVQELLEFNKALKNNSEFMDVVKNDLDIGGVFVFTPKGDVHELRYGSTPLDFAYAVHTEVGNHCVGAKINGKMVSLKYRLKSGDSVDILTSKTQAPSKDWLNIVKTTRAKAKIKQWLLKVERSRFKEVGEDIVDKLLKKFATNIGALRKNGMVDKCLSHFKVDTLDDFYVHVGSGKFTTGQIVSAIPYLEEKRHEVDDIDIKPFAEKLSKSNQKRLKSNNAIIVDGMSDVVVRMGKCCNPIPGDAILGYITRGRGITVHTAECTRVDHAEFGRNVHVEWNADLNTKHPVNIKIITHDKPGVLSLISQLINGLKINIRSAVARSLPDRKGSFLFEIEVHDYTELLKAISAIESLKEVISVSRA